MMGRRQWRILFSILILLGSETKTATAIMNCIQARDFCMDNSNCSPILEIVPRVCGPEKVACSTVTVTKCQAALRTLQSFPYFAPTCLCKEPASDPTCNTFRDYLFDHPCSFVKEKGIHTKEKDPYPVMSLPTCDYAMDVCKSQPKCNLLQRNFRNHCKSADKQCKMEDGELCHDAWTKIRMSPMFGCICPSNDNRCERIFSEVNYNPCVASGDSFLELAGSTSALVMLEDREVHFSFSPASLFPPRPGTHFVHSAEHAALWTPGTSVPAARTDSHLSVDEFLSTPISYQGFPPPGSFSTTSHSGSITVQVISSSHAPDHDESQIEVPLLGGHVQPDNMPPIVPVLHPPSYHQKTTTIRQEDLRPKQPFLPNIATISSVSRTHPGLHPRVILHMTCYTALQNCLRHPSCQNLLQSVLHWCEASRCRQDTCMLALQKFYRSVEIRWALEVAYCICSRSEKRYDQCLAAQHQLHPICAQRGDFGLTPPSCHSLADACREEADCRARLEYFEQACAVDSVTRKCAGPVAECRNAMIGILGTRLRTTCACNGTDVTHLYDCMGWQRILWFNPCVVESQRDYHRIRTTTAAPTPRSSSTTTTSTTTSTQTTDRRPITTTIIETPSTLTERSTLRVSTPRFHPPVTVERREETPAEASTFSSSFSSSTGMRTSPEELTTLTTTTTTSTPKPTTTPPPRVCTIRRPNQANQHIIEGTSKRLYREDKPACSELCYCVPGEPASCNVLECLRTASCESRKGDNYDHGHPTYIAHRGKCICYAGRFICERPPQDTYTLYTGVFLFLGYSSSDEQVLKPHTQLTARDVVTALQHLISPHFQHQYVHPSDSEDPGIAKLRKLNTTECHLDLFKMEGENLIINATIIEEDFGNYSVGQPSKQLLLKEKELCLPAIMTLRDLVNDQNPVIHNHMLLSILKLAGVEELIPINSNAKRDLPYIFLLALLILFQVL